MIRSEWEVDIIFEPSFEAMTVYFNDETFADEEPMNERQVIDAVIDMLSIVPRKVS